MPLAAPTSTPLDYAHGPTLPRRAWRRRVVAGLLLAAIAWVTWRVGPGAWRKANLLRVQHAAMSYSQPMDQIVYDEDPLTADRFLAGDKKGEWVGYPMVHEIGPDTSIKNHFAGRVPAVWSRFETEAIAAAPVWPFNPGPAPILFLGQRTSPRGHVRLLCVRYFPPRDGSRPVFLPGWDCEAINITPATWRAAPLLHVTPNNYVPSAHIVRTYPFATRIYAGQADARDPAHFFARIEQEKQTLTLDGWLEDDETVTMKIRDPREDPKW